VDGARGVVAAFAPASAAGFSWPALAAASLLALGARSAARPRVERPRAAWLAGALGIAFAHVATLDEPAGWRMLALVAVTFAAAKTLVAASTHVRLTPPAWWRFALGWVGMDPRPFARSRARADGAGGLARRGGACLLAGAALLALARVSPGPVAIVLAFVACSLLVHFGAFPLLAAAWRLRGVPAREPFAAPHRATSLREFWARRWNRPFSELTRLAVYAPLAGRGRAFALLAGFAFSGLLHELAISLPVRAGYGLPTLYFLLHGVAVLLEERLERAGRAPTGLAARAWCAAWLLFPLPLLFHAPFRTALVAPLVAG